MDAATQSLQDNTYENLENTLPGVVAKIEALKLWVEKDKATKSSEVLDIEAFSGNIALKLRSNKRPPYTPPAGLTLPVHIII